MVKHRIKIAPGTRSNIVEIDGVNIASSVAALQFSAHATQGSHLVVDLFVEKGSKIEADDATVTIPEATARVLLLLGWTPPSANPFVALAPGSTVDRRCGSEYTRPGGRERGDRIIRCHLAHGHPGEHEEADTEVTWRTDYVPDESRVSAIAAATGVPAAALQARVDQIAAGRREREATPPGERCVDGPAEDCPRRVDVTGLDAEVSEFAHGCPVDPADFEEVPPL